ncbi:hypothetical protein V3C99_010936 [Haemonchus contortus]
MHLRYESYSSFLIISNSDFNEAQRKQHGAMSYSRSGLSILDCDTAEEIEEAPCSFIRFEMAINDVSIDGVKVGPKRSEFMFEEFLFTIKLVEESGVRTVYFSCVTSPDYEWRLNTQMRIKTGTAGSTALRVVDKDVFEFYPRCDPVSVELMSDAISIVKFELRILNKLIERLPTFREGDLIVLFSDGSTIKVHRELVALFSTYIKKCTEGSEVTSVENFSKKAFIEMLYHIYPTLRPLYRNLRDFAKAAVSYESTPLIYQLSKHLVNFNTRSVSS